MTMARIGVRLTIYIPDDEKWVIQTVSKYKKGISTKELNKLALKDRKKKRENILDTSFGMHNEPVSKLPPGRDKIKQILQNGEGKHWETVVGGGRGNRTLIRPLKIDPIEVLTRGGYVMDYNTMRENLKKFKNMGDVLYPLEPKRFNRKDFFDYATLKNKMLRLPMEIFFQSGDYIGGNKEELFNKLVSEVTKQIKIMKKIESDQLQLRPNFSKILKTVEKVVENKASGELILKTVKKKQWILVSMDDKFPGGLSKDLVPLRNELHRIFIA